MLVSLLACTLLVYWHSSSFQCADTLSRMLLFTDVHKRTPNVRCERKYFRDFTIGQYLSCFGF